MNSVLPIYFQVKQTIRSWLINKEFSSGEKIPSEMELVRRFRASRLTIRQALSQLVQEGFLVSRRGEGTYVSANEKLINSFNAEFRGFLDDIIPRGVRLETKSVAMKCMTAPKLVMEKLELESGKLEVVQIKRVRFLRGKHFAYAVNYLPAEIGSKIADKQLYRRPLMQILEQDLGIRLTDAVQTIEASFADQEVAGKLAVASGSPILHVEKIMYAQKHKPIELFMCSYRGDLCKFIVRFKNVRSRWVHDRMDKH